MNKSNSSSKPSSSNSKSRRNTKDRDRRRKQPVEINSQHIPTEIQFISSIEITKGQFAGISQEQLRNYAEQVGFEDLPKDVAEGFTEDLNYKLRHVIHDALTRARLSNRNTISTNDVNDAFDSLGLEKVYGAPENPSWMPLDKRLYYLEDKRVNLIELAEEETSLLQPADLVVTNKLISNPKDVEKPMKNYFKIICESVVSNDSHTHHCALQDIKENTKIGPVIEWLYHFAYQLLSNHFMNNHLTLRALDIIQAVEQNPIAGLSVSENMINSLSLLILQKLFSKFETSATLKETCYTLALLCTRQQLREMVVTKILQRITENRDFNTLHVLSILNAMGIDVIEVVFVEYIDEFQRRISENSNDTAIQHETMCLYNTIRKNSTEASKVDVLIRKIFGNWLSIFRKPVGMICSTAPECQEIDFGKAKANLFKTRRKIEAVYKQKKHVDITAVFEETEHNKKIFLQAKSGTVVNGNSKKQHLVAIGKTNLMTSIPKFFKYKPAARKQHCDYDHSMFYNI